MIEYKLKELGPDEEKPVDLLSTPIESRGQVVTFTMNEIVGDKLAYDKQIKELKAELNFESAKIENIEMHHPFVKDMEASDLLACYMYAEAKARAKARMDVIAKIEQQKIELENEVAGIKEQLPEFNEFSIENEGIPAENKESEPEE